MPDDPPVQPATSPPPPGRVPTPPTSVGAPVGPADPWPHTGPTELAHHPVPAPARGWRRRFWAPLIAGTAVLGVTAFLVVFFWPGGSLEFQPLDPVGMIPVGDEQTDPRLVDLDGDEVAIAAERDGEVVVFGASVSGDGARWERSLPDLRRAVTLVRYDDVVTVFGDNGGDGAGAPYRLAVLDAGTGERLWTHEYGYDASWLLFDRRLSLVDDASGTLTGLAPRSGAKIWTLRFPEGGAAVAPVTTEADLAGPSRVDRPDDLPRRGDRVVVVGGDGSARLIDVGTGEPVGEAGANVADPRDLVYAYEDRLFVVSGDEGRVYRFALTDLPAQPEILHSLTDPGARITDLVPCGTDRICLREENAEGARVLWVDSGGGGVRGQATTGEASPELLLPAGDRLVVGTDAGTTVVFELDGAERQTRPGVPVRVDGADILVAVSDHLVSGYGYGSMILTGIPLHADEPTRTELGQVSDVAAGGCAWDDRLLVCPTSEGAGVWRFATE
jgi:molecular chaperone HscA